MSADEDADRERAALLAGLERIVERFPGPLISDLASADVAVLFMRDGEPFANGMQPVAVRVVELEPVGVDNIVESLESLITALRAGDMSIRP